MPSHLPGLARSRAELRQRVAANLRLQREARGLSQEAMAELAGLSLQYVQRLEWGRHNIPLDTVARLAVALRIDAADLFQTQGSGHQFAR